MVRSLQVQSKGVRVREARPRSSSTADVGVVPHRPIVLRARLAQNISGYGKEARLASCGTAADNHYAHLGASVSVVLETLDDALAAVRKKLERDDVAFDGAPSYAVMLDALEHLVRNAYPDGEIVPVRMEHIWSPPLGWVRIGGLSTPVAAPVGAVIALHENDGNGGAGPPVGFTWSAGDAGPVQISALLVLRP